MCFSRIHRATAQPFTGVSGDGSRAAAASASTATEWATYYGECANGWSRIELTDVDVDTTQAQARSAPLRGCFRVLPISRSTAPFARQQAAQTDAVGSVSWWDAMAACRASNAELLFAETTSEAAWIQRVLLQSLTTRPVNVPLNLHRELYCRDRAAVRKQQWCWSTGLWHDAGSDAAQQLHWRHNAFRYSRTRTGRALYYMYIHNSYTLLLLQ